VDVEAPGGEGRNVQTGGRDRVSTISLLGCSTSVALATGPTDEEEEEEEEEPMAPSYNSVIIYPFFVIHFVHAYKVIQHN